MTTATVKEFVKEVQQLNPSLKDHIRVGMGIDRVIYTGGDPRELVVPEPFAWNEEMQGFTDLDTLQRLGWAPVYQLFTVHKE